MVLRKKGLFALGVVIALSSSSSFAAPKKKGKKKAPAATEEGTMTEGGTETTAAGGGSWAPKYGMAGCGLGSIVLEENTKLMQILGATLNGTSANQTFGITFGTSNCNAGAQSAAANKAAQEMFVANNLNALSKEAAQGEGQTLNAFAFMLGCQGDNVNQFAKLSRESYDAVYSNDNPTVVLDRMIEEVKADEQLAASCNKA